MLMPCLIIWQICCQGEHYALKWETKYLVTLGTRFEKWLAESVVQTSAIQFAAAGDFLLSCWYSVADSTLLLSLISA